MANPNVLGKRKRGESEEEDQQDDESRRPKRAKRPANVRDKLRDLYRLRITAKIKSEFQVLQLVEYRLGAQGANTQCYGTQYKTGHKGQPNMHSEILAIKDQLEKPNNQQTIQLTADGTIRPVNGNNGTVPAAQFTTQEPHCGFCTYFLKILGLPLGQPTIGKPNLGWQSYPIPKQIKENLGVVQKLCGNDPQLLAQILATVAGEPIHIIGTQLGPEDAEIKMSWDDLVKKHSKWLDEIWNFFKEVLQELLVESKH